MTRRRQIVSVVAAILGIPLVGIVGFVAMNWAVVSTFPGMPSAYESKELCSCLWVEGRSEDDCLKFIAQSVVPIQGRTIDTTGKTVEVAALWTTTLARWVDTPTGCVLE